MKRTVLRLELVVHESRPGAAFDAVRVIVGEDDLRDAIASVARSRGNEVSLEYARLEHSLCCELMRSFADRIQAVLDGGGEDVKLAAVAVDVAKRYQQMMKPPGARW